MTGLFVRAILDRPFLTAIMVITSLITLGLTGPYALVSPNSFVDDGTAINTVHAFFKAWAGFLLLGVVILGLPYSKLYIPDPYKISVSVIICAIFFCVCRVISADGDAQISLEIIIGVITGCLAIGVGARLLAAASWQVVLSTGLIAACVFAGSALLPNSESKNLTLVVLSLLSASITILISQTNSELRCLGLEKKDAAREALLTTLPYAYWVMVSMGLMVGAISLLGEPLKGASYPSFAFSMLLCAGIFVFVPVIVIPGWYWLRDRSPLAVNEANSADQLSHIPLFEGVAKQYLLKIQRLYAVSSSNGFLAAALIVALVLFFLAPAHEGMVIILISMLIALMAGVCFLSLRVFLFAAGVLLLSLSLVSGFSRTMLGYDAAPDFISLFYLSTLVGFFILIPAAKFSEISARTQYRQSVFQTVLREALGPFLFIFGAVILLVAMAIQSGLIADTQMSLWVFIGTFYSALVIWPAMLVALSARYGRL